MPQLRPISVMRVSFPPCTAVSPFASSAHPTPFTAPAAAPAAATPVAAPPPATPHAPPRAPGQSPTPAHHGCNAALDWLDGWGRVAETQGVAAAAPSPRPAPGSLLASPFGSAWLHASLFEPDPAPPVRSR